MSAESVESAPSGKLRLAVLVGSVRDGRFGPVVADWYSGQARQYGSYDVDVIDLAEAENTLPLVFPAFGTQPAPEVQRVRSGLSARLAAADAFVIVTPEYNHSFPASLKNVIDWFKPEWAAKPVGFVSYGGMVGGQRAVEQLRQVFPELHAVTIRETLAFNLMAGAFGEEGLPSDLESAETAAKGMLGQLEWWADALRVARARTPFGSAG